MNKYDEAEHARVRVFDWARKHGVKVAVEITVDWVRVELLGVRVDGDFRDPCVHAYLDHRVDDAIARACLELETEYLQPAGTITVTTTVEYSS